MTRPKPVAKPTAMTIGYTKDAAATATATTAVDAVITSSEGLFEAGRAGIMEVATGNPADIHITNISTTNFFGHDGDGHIFSDGGASRAASLWPSRRVRSNCSSRYRSGRYNEPPEDMMTASTTAAAVAVTPFVTLMIYRGTLGDGRVPCGRPGRQVTAGANRAAFRYDIELLT